MSIFYIIVFIFFLLFVSELSVRFYYKKWGKRYVWTPHTETCLYIDQTALPAIKSECRFDVNCDGELGLALPTSSFYRILTLGGSAVECYYLGSDRSWPALLQYKLNADKLKRFSRKIVHVGNIAKSVLIPRTRVLSLKGFCQTIVV